MFFVQICMNLNKDLACFIVNNIKIHFHVTFFSLQICKFDQSDPFSQSLINFKGFKLFGGVVCCCFLCKRLSSKMNKLIRICNTENPFIFTLPAHVNFVKLILLNAITITSIIEENRQMFATKP